MAIDINYLLGFLSYFSVENKFDPTYDLNADGFITVADLMILLASYGTTI